MKQFSLILHGAYGMGNIIAHVMEYGGGPIKSYINPEQYSDIYYEEYKKIYEDCFHEMRTALELQPVNACDSREELLEKQNEVFLYINNEELIGSVAIYDNEIDDLIIANNYQRKGYGQLLLRFAISHMQKKYISPILLHVADWNKGAINLYLKNGFKIIETEVIRRT